MLEFIRKKYSIKAIVLLVASVLLLVGAMAFFVPGPGLRAQTSNCTPATLPCPPVGSTVSITISGGDGGGGGGSGGGGGTRESTLGNVLFQGLAYPAGIVTILLDGGVAASFIVPSDGSFSRQLTNIPAGIHSFGVWGYDADGRISPTISLSLNVAGGTTTTISSLVLPPTISAVSPVPQGVPVNILGQSFPGALIYLFYYSGAPLAQVVAGADGRWSYSLDTKIISTGVYEIRAQAQTRAGEYSVFSNVLRFSIVPAGIFPPPVVTPPAVTPPPPARACSPNLNGDNHVDLVDFSIMLYYWHKNTTHCADLNGDGWVDLIDISILLYWWIG